MNTRLIASRVLLRVLQDGQSLTAALDAAFLNLEAGKDKAFIQALVFGVCRNFHRLDFILNQLLSKPVKDMEIKSLALVGLYQLAFMRVKPHAAVSETLLAVSKKKSWAKPLLNAVLRSYLRDKPRFEKLANTTQVSALSHPEWLISRIEQDWESMAGQIFLANNQAPPMSLRVNLARISREQYLQQLIERGLEAATVEFCPSALVLEKPVPVDLLPGFADGLVSVQDVAAQLASSLLDIQSGQRVLDVCAAPGGKSAHILEQQPRLKELLAIDIDAQRMQRVRENLQRLNLSATLVVGDAVNPDDWWNGVQFDRILVDAPCSATGVIRRHPDIKLLRKPLDIMPLQVMQKTILDAVWPLLVPGGRLLYASCSVLKQENEQLIQSFLSEYKNAGEIKIEAAWGVSSLCGRQILTGESNMDGFYYALIQKL